MSAQATSRMLQLTPALSPMVRLQYERAQTCWVLLYPEGMVRLNDPASEILQRCDGRRQIIQIVSELQERFGEADLRDDVCEFTSQAYERGWII